MTPRQQANLVNRLPVGGLPTVTADDIAERAGVPRWKVVYHLKKLLPEHPGRNCRYLLYESEAAQVVAYLKIVARSHRRMHRRSLENLKVKQQRRQECDLYGRT
jgi:hypothetical protein